MRVRDRNMISMAIASCRIQTCTAAMTACTNVTWAAWLT